MKTVITYGTYDFLHKGHIRLLERAKALGDYLIVGVTASDFDAVRGKINVQQSLMDRIEAVRATGLADRIIVEEYEGQKIDDIKRYNVDIFTVGSDWRGKFDYLNKYCEVVYLERTRGISSSDIRAEDNLIKMGFVGEVPFIAKHISESHYVNGLVPAGLCTCNAELKSFASVCSVPLYEDYADMLPDCDAVFVMSHPKNHYEHAKKALTEGKHVLVESPVCMTRTQYDELEKLAALNDLCFAEAIKTAYSTAFHRMLLLVKSGRIGEVVSVDATCTSLFDPKKIAEEGSVWDSMLYWGPTAMLPVFRVLGTEWVDKEFVVKNSKRSGGIDYVRGNFYYKNATASISVGRGVKSEGDLKISGTLGYVYVPAPWWKTDYFELRYENPSDNRRYFYQLDGEGIRNELAAFTRSASLCGGGLEIAGDVTRCICGLVEDYEAGVDTRVFG